MKTMTVKEFRDLGYLQEVNRRFLHPLGLALSVVIEDDGTGRFADIWDARDDPEGIAYAEDETGVVVDQEKKAYIDREIARRSPGREERLGYWIQE